MDSTDREVITAGPGLLIQIRRHLRRLSYTCHRAIPQVIVRGPRFFLELLIWPAARCCNAICILCTLPWRVSVFDTTNKAFHFDGVLSQRGRAGWRPGVFSEWDGAVCSGCGWSRETDCVKQKCCVRQPLLAPSATFHSHSLQKKTKKKKTTRRFSTSTGWEFSEGEIITLQRIITAVRDFPAIQFNYIDKQPFQKQLEPDFNWTASQLSFPLIWLSHFWIAFDDRTKQSRWDNHLHCDAALTPILRNTADLPCR